METKRNRNIYSLQLFLAAFLLVQVLVELSSQFRVAAMQASTERVQYSGSMVECSDEMAEEELSMESETSRRIVRAVKYITPGVLRSDAPFCGKVKRASEKYIFEHITIEKFPVIPSRISHGASCFSDRCKDNGNPEALFRQGMFEFFSSKKPESGFQHLEKTAKKGHLEAIHTCSIILVCHGGQFKQEGIELLSSLMSYNSRHWANKECRNKIKGILQSICGETKVKVILDRRAMEEPATVANLLKRGWIDEEDCAILAFGTLGDKVAAKTNGCNGSIAECDEEYEFLMPSHVSRRYLEEKRKYISPGALKPDQPVCNDGASGQSYSSSCLPPPSNSPSRGCSKYYRCRSDD
ncbi:hypothetical protein POTOM_002477 [Populus tomentosa]|uniref:At2g35280-like TPR domain-containing protein n=1 Tax=Populus tomentosa TaxID=118781 RepID=A0A8X8IZ79_POPTO|nr:hypothetical protein POTOM_002477 [Populus tomentosa]